MRPIEFGVRTSWWFIGGDRWRDWRSFSFGAVSDAFGVLRVSGAIRTLRTTGPG